MNCFCFKIIKYLFRLIKKDFVDGKCYLVGKNGREREAEPHNRNNYAACCYINTYIYKRETVSVQPVYDQ